MGRIHERLCCPKCGNSEYRWYHGPVYDEGKMQGGEHLKYSCRRCGYSWRELTHSREKERETNRS